MTVTVTPDTYSWFWWTFQRGGGVTRTGDVRNETGKRYSFLLALNVYNVFCVKLQNSISENIVLQQPLILLNHVLDLKTELFFLYNYG